MNTKARRSLHHIKKSEKEKIEIMQRSGCTLDSEKPSTSRRCTSRERKMALQQDVDKLKKRLRHEENVHRALERAFTRPLGARPRLPPYLPSHMLELLAEVAILEEEVVRLEERVVHFRQGLYQEAVHVSCSKKNMEIWDADLSEPNRIKYPNTKQLESTLCVESHSGEIISNDSPSQLCNAKKDPASTCTDAWRREEKPEISKSLPLRKHPIECGPGERRLDPQSPQLESRVVDNSPNKISESILKCLMNIILRMSFKSNRNSEYGDPYNICCEFGERDIGPYKKLFAFETDSIDPNRMTISVFLVRRLEVLFQRLATLSLKGLSHQEKLAFWINIYNSCMMNAFIENGFPKSPESVVELMQKATLNVGGYILNAITIEHFILRRPYHSKYTFSKGTKYDEMMKSSVLGLELSEPLVTFALSCGSWSSPAVRVYTSSQVENELEIAKRDYLQAAVGILRIERVIVAIPKLLDWYLLDFAKDFESLLDWIRLQLPTELGNEGGDEPLRIMPTAQQKLDGTKMEVIGGASPPTNIRRYYLSAPTSPSHLSQHNVKGLHDSPDAVGSCRLSSAAVPFEWEETPGTPKSPAVRTNTGDDFAFQITGNNENAPLSAEDLFDGGVIRPLKPPPRLQIPPAAASPQRKLPAKVIPGALFSPARNRRAAARSISPIRGRGLSWKDEEGDGEGGKGSPPSGAVSSAKGQKKWRLKDLFLFRSASEGRAADKDPLKKYTGALVRSSFTGGSESMRRREPVSAHEVHYKANRAVSEDLKKKTFLPYKQGILGRLAFHPAH